MADRSIVLVRHGETEWSRSSRHTGRTDIPLTEAGKEAARGLSPKLASFHFERVLSSPLSRAWDTCVLAGFGDRAEKTDALLEWDYGDYEGKTNAEIRKTIPGWTVFTHGASNGETAADVEKRLAPLIESFEQGKEDVLIFAHAHLLRVLTGCYLGLGAAGGRLFILETARISILGWERETRVVRRWSC